MRRSIKFYCGRDGLREAISRIARHYGLVDERGTPNDSEIVRLLLVTALTQNAPNRVQAAVDIAVAVQKPMMASALGRRIATEYATGQGHVVAGRRGANERRNTARVVLDDWLHESLTALSPYYQDDLGRIHDGKLMADMAMAGARDASLHAIVVGYLARTSVLRERLAEAEMWIRQVVAGAMNEEQRRAG
ncbi:MAG: hypothetical protein PHU43_10975 [Candidatus Bipolaricaulis sp.]|nr:hypothetical protein [Candidatus Bipolaricaulis sp.]